MQASPKVQLNKLQLSSSNKSNGSTFTVGSDNSASTQGSSGSSQASKNSFTCFLMTKNSSLSQYTLQITSKTASIISSAKGRVKAEISLMSAQIKQMPKQARSTGSESSTDESSPVASNSNSKS